MVLVLGMENVGKTSFLRNISKDKKAVVDPTPGTTVDIRLVETRIHGQCVTLYDTPGFNRTIPESSYLQQLIRQASTILYIIDPTREEFHQDKRYINFIRRNNDNNIIFCSSKAAF